jgi:DNA-binding beta-propeller fold protein YncE
MTLRHLGFVELPPNAMPGGFDHAAVHRRASRLYVAHTCNDSLDVIDCARDVYLHSIPNLTSVAGALASDEQNLIFTSNRGENTVGIFTPEDEAGLTKMGVGVKPNGLAFDPSRKLLLAANVGDAALPDSHTVSIVDAAQREMIASVPVPGRTRWTIFDPNSACFFVNIMSPPIIAVIDAREPSHIARTLDVPADGPHGLDFDVTTNRLFCACDGKRLIAFDANSGGVLQLAELGGVPDVIFINAAFGHLYVAIGDPGVVEVFDTATLAHIETVPTEAGAHTIAFDATRNKVYAFLPQTHRAIVFVDEA